MTSLMRLQVLPRRILMQMLSRCYVRDVVVVIIILVTAVAAARMKDVQFGAFGGFVLTRDVGDVEEHSSGEIATLR